MMITVQVCKIAGSQNALIKILYFESVQTYIPFKQCRYSCRIAPEIRWNEPAEASHCHCFERWCNAAAIPSEIRSIENKHLQKQTLHICSALLLEDIQYVLFGICCYLEFGMFNPYAELQPFFEIMCLILDGLNQNYQN